MKKLAVIVAALTLALSLAGCACSSVSSSSASSSGSSMSASDTSSSASSSSASSSASSSSAPVKQVAVPDLKGKTQSDAEKALADVKLVAVSSNPEESDEVAPGQVFKQSIAAGTTVAEGTIVTFTIALAPSEVEVPNVVGKTHDEAKDAIMGAKLAFDYTTAYDSDVEENRVISQSIDAGQKVKAGTEVSVVVSLGAKPTPNVKVPDLMTYSWDEVKATLDSAGLNADYTGNKNGQVVQQDIAPGTMVEPGTTVTVDLETPDPEPGQNPIMGFIGPYGADRASIQVDPLNDDSGSITVTWSTSASEESVWTMSGKFNANKLTLKYTDGKKVDRVYDDDGNIKSETVVYTDGSGTFTFKDENPLSLTWKDEVEHVADGTTFTWAG